MTIAVGSDHAGYNLKAAVARRLAELGHRVEDLGTHSLDSVDYPELAARVARAVAQGRADRGVLVCGSGVGMSMCANRFPGVRAVLAPSADHARLGRQHNDANVLCLGERLTPEGEALAILEAFLNASFEGGRHQRRVDQIDQINGESV
ncbi:MAG: ribose 5-phosphate isomerase B [Deltaproteobacteria bacterium]|nr:ribose 5-phosphate isomerase B [Deltaproteobacteria bacterium]